MRVREILILLLLVHALVATVPVSVDVRDGKMVERIKVVFIRMMLVC